MKLTIVEEIIGQGVIDTIVVNLPTDKLTLKDIITAKVAATVNAINKDPTTVKSNHHFLSDEEKRLNQDLLQKKNKELQKRVESLKLDAEKETYIALEAFQNNMFFVLIDEKQYSDLEESVVITDQSQVKFIKLTQLQGG
ncbi:hypothetical protein [Olleya sp. HaHaR_3_96]|uniref:hypothetical protein n=1 Tax=Olleya sp. HaHaR_3_96 TaxID=2745560 RepID=UPI001C4F26DC|nr:hypothetical protein [Olleya sp. HaHaR_3_96]QXP58768.1 hypothetical protein H0I26_12700 [Olleya sp. HaHaR_3_96]